MAQYQHLPIYKTTYELLQLVTMLSRGFAKDFRYTLGARLRDECVELVLLIYRANSNRTRRAVIEAVLERIQVLELLLRLCKDMRLIGVKPFSSACELTDSLGRQASGWLKSTPPAMAES
jgi:hypothetical protein